MIIFGWRSKGETEWSGLLNCAACDRWTNHFGIKVNRYFTLFFVPVLPLWNDTKVVCGLCLAERRLLPAEFQAIKQVAIANRNLVLAVQDQPFRSEELLSQLTDPSAAGPEVRWLLPSPAPAAAPDVEPSAPPLGHEDVMASGANFCPDCGWPQSNPYRRFCSQCGRHLDTTEGLTPQGQTEPSTAPRSRRRYRRRA